MRVYFLRHGIAEDARTWSGSDFDRALTDEGRERMEREAKAIDHLSLGLKRIITSPLLRAKQTAEIVADRLKMNDDLVEDPKLAGGFTFDRLAGMLAAQGMPESVLLVGHEPNMSVSLGRAIGSANVELKKAGLAGVEFAEAPPETGTLICLIPPKVLVALGKS